MIPRGGAARSPGVELAGEEEAGLQEETVPGARPPSVEEGIDADCSVLKERHLTGGDIVVARWMGEDDGCNIMRRFTLGSRSKRCVLSERTAGTDMLRSLVVHKMTLHISRRYK